MSRKRIWLILLIIRYTGARLNEVLILNPMTVFQGVSRKKSLSQLCCLAKIII